MSRITEIEILEFDHQISQNYDAVGDVLNGAAPLRRHVRRLAIRIRTDDGVEGSYVTLWSAPPQTISQVPFMAEIVIGSSIFDRELVWDRLNNTFAKTDRIGGVLTLVMLFGPCR